MTAPPQDAARALKPASFRKKPVMVEAMLWDGSFQSADAIEEWSEGITKCRGYDKNMMLREPALESNVGIGIFILTMEGEMRADANDWIIKGLKGEFYPCKPDIFAMTYEPADRRAEQDDGWQPIETAPKTSHAILVWCPDRKNIYVVSWFDDPTRASYWTFFGGGAVRPLFETPTHWRPLPTPPKAPHGE